MTGKQGNNRFVRRESIRCQKLPVRLKSLHCIKHRVPHKINFPVILFVELLFKWQDHKKSVNVCFEFYKQYDWEVDYVGNPVLDAVKAFQADREFLTTNGFVTDKPIVALLPGSRRMELMRTVPVLVEVVRKHPELQFAVAEVDDVDQTLYSPLQEAGVKLISGDTYNLLANSRAAIVTSGTATLEAALLKVPQVCIYKAGWLEMKIGKAVVKVKFISLVNLIAGKAVIRELIQEDATAKEISTELSELLLNEAYRKGMLNEYGDIYKTLDTGSASENTARLMVGYLRK